MFNRTLILLFLIIIAFSCNNTSYYRQAEDSEQINNIYRTKKGNLSISISYFGNNKKTRTVVADFSEQIKSWTVTLSRDDYNSILSDSNTPNGSITIENIEAGNWAVLVQGKNVSGEVVASGETTVNIVEETDNTCNVVVSFFQNGTGDMSLKIVFPQSTDITDVSADLYSYSDSSLIQSFNIADFTTEGANYSVTFVNDDPLPSGAYQLVINFTRETKDAGTFREAINIWDNVISNKWIGSDGKLLDYREFSRTDFFDNNASLSNLTLTNVLAGTFTFSSSTQTYDNVGTQANTVTFIPTQSIAGQKIEYSTDGTNYNQISSGSSAELTISSPTNLSIKVTAPDRQTIKEYTININRAYALIYDANGGSGDVPDTVYHTAGTDATVDGNTGGLTKTDSSFAGWNTNANGSGTPYCKDETIDMTADITLYAQWVEGEFWIVGSNSFNNSVTWNNGTIKETQNSNYSKIFVQADDIGNTHAYIADGSKLVKDGSDLTSCTDCQLASVFNLNDTTYACGNTNQSKGFYYSTANGFQLSLGRITNSISSANDIYSDGLSTYIAGVQNDKPYLFIISNLYKEIELYSSNGSANAITVFNDKVYITGTVGNSLYLWIYNGDGTLVSANLIANSTGHTPNAIAIKDDNIYIVGNVGNSAIYGHFSNTNGGTTFSSAGYLPHGESADGVTIIGNKAYIVGREKKTGYDSKYALLWTVEGSGTPNTYKLWSNQDNAYATSISQKNYTVSQYSNSVYGANTVLTMPAGYTTKLKTFTKQGWTFEKWYSDEALTQPTSYANDGTSQITISNENVKLYAKWTPPATFAIEDVGPAGGYVFHDAGSDTNGWRYLEIAPPIGLQGALGINQYVWSTEAKQSESAGTEESLGSGKLNTQKIINQNGDGGNYAAKVANQFITNYNGVEYNDWFLPSKNELDVIENNKDFHAKASLTWDYFSSSENSSNVYGYWYDGGVNIAGLYNWIKSSSRQVRPIRAFKTTEKPTYIVLYNGNGANDGAPPTDTNYHEKGAEVTVLGNSGTLTKTDYAFIGWNTKADGSGVTYQPSDNFDITGDVVLYAKWGRISSSGGLVFYENPNTNWATEDGWRYLETTTDKIDENKIWANYFANIGTSSAIGMGKINTAKIIAKHGTGYDTGPELCDSYSVPVGGTTFDDWFLPSYDELKRIEANIGTGGDYYTFGSGYMSSTESSSNYYFKINYQGGMLLSHSKTEGSNKVQPIRAFRSLTNNQPTYIVLYDKNGVSVSGTPPVDNFYYESGEQVTVALKGNLALTGKYFSGWNTNKAGSGVSYMEGAKFTITNNVTLYAQWVEAVAISTPEELAAIGTDATTLSGSYFLMNDIDISTYNNGAWTPIGSSSTPFTGTFYGNGKTISGLTITGGNYIGLFGYTDTTSVIKNLNLSGVTISGLSYLGALVGLNRGKVTNCHVLSGSVSGYDHIGGLIGRNEYASGIVTDSSASVTVTGHMQVGGLIGSNNAGPVSNCYATGNVTGVKNVGGLIGENTAARVNKTFASGNVQATDSDSFVGGLIGSNSNETISNSYAVGNVTGTCYVGGLVAKNALPGGKIINCFSTGVITAEDYNCGGLVGYLEYAGNVTASYYDTNTSGRSDTGKGEPKTTAQMKDTLNISTNYPGWDFTNTWGITIDFSKNWGYPYLQGIYPADIYTALYSSGNATGGVPPYDNTFYKTGDTVTIKDNTRNLERTGHSFVGWTTDPDGMGTVYSFGGTNSTISVGTENITLYPKWSIESYTLNYDANGGSGNLPSPVVYQYNAPVTVTSNTLSKEGYVFDGWTTDLNGWGKNYLSGDTFNMPGNDLTLYARFAKSDFTVSSVVFKNKTVGVEGKLENGDQIIITFSDAVDSYSINKKMNPNTTYSLGYLESLFSLMISNNGNNGESDFYLTQSDKTHIGQLKLHGNMKTATSGPNYYCAANFETIHLSADSKTLTITLGNISSLYINSFAPQTSSANIRFYPSGNIKRTSDNAFISQSEYYCNAVGITATF